MKRVELAKSPEKDDGQLPEVGEDDNDRLSVSVWNLESYPFASTADVHNPSSSSPWADISNEMMEPPINDNVESLNGLNPGGIILQQQNVTFSEGSPGVLEVALHSGVEVSSGVKLGNNIISNATDTVHLNGLVELPTAGQNNDNDRLSAIFWNLESVPFAANIGVDTPSSSSPWADNSNEMMVQMINNNAESLNGLNPDEITLQQQNVTFAGESRGALDVPFNSGDELSNRVKFSNNIISNAPDTIHLNGRALVEPSNTGQNDDNDHLSAIIWNLESYPFASITDVDTPSSSSPWGDNSNEMMEPTINNNAESPNGVSPDGITLQQQNMTFAGRSHGVLDVAFNSGVEVSSGVEFENNIISNALDPIHFNGRALVEPSSTGQNGTVSVQDLADTDAYGAGAGAGAGADQSGIRNALGIQQSPPKRKAPQPEHNVDQKRRPNAGKDNNLHCTCKRSRCLNRYCKCFSDGTYCGKSCSCANCHNNKEYEDTVEKEREKKMSQNPNAFDSKLEAENGTTPIRHKRGCNCRKSKCVKKYCECYQADIGCSEVCRCEDCKNPYNRKSDPNKMPNSNGNVPSAYGTVSQQNAS